MGILSHDEIIELLDRGVVENALKENVNSASLDIRIGDTILVEGIEDKIVSLDKKETINLVELSIEKPRPIHPGMFFLAHSIEVFNLPNDISAQFMLRSSIGRSGLDHLKAGWCDSGWHGSTLTMEFANQCQHHTLEIVRGLRVGQIVFFKHKEVDALKSYATKGRYNNDSKVQGSKGV